MVINWSLWRKLNEKKNGPRTPTYRCEGWNFEKKELCWWSQDVVQVYCLYFARSGWKTEMTRVGGYHQVPDFHQGHLIVHVALIALWFAALKKKKCRNEKHGGGGGEWSFSDNHVSHKHTHTSWRLSHIQRELSRKQLSRIHFSAVNACVHR